MDNTANYRGYKYNGGKVIESYRCGRLVCILRNLMDSESPLQEHWGTLQQHQSTSNVPSPEDPASAPELCGLCQWQ